MNAIYAMKTLPILTFAAGAAAASAAFLFWPAAESADAAKLSAQTVRGAGLEEENAKLTARVKQLEKQAAAGGGANAAAEPGASGRGTPRQVAQHFDESKMEEMMKRQAEREVNRETDKLALRLKLTPDQKEELRKFLLARKEREREMFRAAMRDGGKVESRPAGPGMEEFLNGLLTPEQQAEYARSLEEQRRARAEDYAQRKVRKLNDQLSLSEEQKDGLFQAFAQRKLTETDPAGAARGDTVTPAAQGGAIAFSAASGDGFVEPVQFDFDVGEIMSPGSGDLDRATLESILTPEQLAVYDQRKAEEKERGPGLIQVEGLPESGTGGAAVRIEVRKESPPAASPEK